MSFETNSEQETFIHRYDVINEANEKSFYMTNPNRSLDVYQSIQSIGPARSPESLAAGRVIAAGNMSPLGPYGPVELSEDERKEDASQNLESFLKSVDIPPSHVFVLWPERDYSTPLSIVNADEQEVDESATTPTRLHASGDFVYSYDPNKVLAARPADCPIMFATADTPKGKIHVLVHYAWKGAGSHYVAQTAEAFDALGVDKDSLEIYLTPGGQAESYPYTSHEDPREVYKNTDGLFANVEKQTNNDGSTTYSFGIDTPKFVYDQVIEQLKVRPEQVFCDTSDTSALNSGYSSHGRSKRLEDTGESNTRDIVLAVFTVQ